MARNEATNGGKMDEREKIINEAYEEFRKHNVDRYNGAFEILQNEEDTTQKRHVFDLVIRSAFLNGLTTGYVIKSDETIKSVFEALIKVDAGKQDNDAGPNPTGN